MLENVLSNLRKEREISQVVVAKRCNMPRTTYRDLENSKVKNPTLFQICKLCRGFDITPNDLIPREYWQGN